MIVKYFDLKKKINENISFYLLYGLNIGLIEETIDKTFKPIFSKNIFNYEENEILVNIEEFKQSIFNKSFFENDKLIIINRASDKILNIIEDIIDKGISETIIIIKYQNSEHFLKKVKVHLQFHFMKTIINHLWA